MRKLSQYMLVVALIIVATLGIPLIFPRKYVPFDGKSVAEKPSLVIRG